MRDSFTETEIGYVPILVEQELRSLHRGNWWIRRIIDVPAMDMVKGGVTIANLKDDAETAQKVLSLYNTGGNKKKYGRKFGGATAFHRAEMYARWFGRGYIVLRVNGNEKLDKPLTKVRSFEGFSVLDRYQLRPSNDSINYEEPDFYQIARRYQKGGELKGAEFNQRIHESRVLVFDGAFIHPYDINLESADGAHDSVIQSLYECFCRHYSVQNAIAKGLDSYSLFKVAISNLGELMMQDEGEAALTKTLDAIAQMISLHRILPQDADAANSEFQERSFTGVKDNADGFRDELTAASGLPHYKLWMSVAKSGLTDSGGAETRAWAETVNSLQISKFKDNHTRVFDALFEATTGAIPDSYDIEYPSIYKPTPQEEAELKETEANTYSTYITAEVLDPLEVKLALATGEDISNVLDAEEIEAELSRSKELAEKQLEVEEAELEQSVQAATAAPVAPGEEAEGGQQPVPAQRTVNGQVVPDLDSAIAQLDSADVVRTDKKKGGKKGKKRNCQKGLSCGNSCISRLKTCRKTPTAKQAGLAQQIRNTVVPFERPAAESSYKIPEDPSGLQELGTGVQGSVYRDGNNAVKYMAAGRELSKEELEISTTMGELGIGPKITGSESNKDGVSKLAMEYMDGFETYSNAQRNMTPEERQVAFRNTLTQVEEMHKNGVAHADLHDENFMVNAAGDVRIIDYGYALRESYDVYKEDLNMFSFGIAGGRDANPGEYEIIEPIVAKYRKTRNPENMTAAESRQASQDFWREINSELDANQESIRQRNANHGLARLRSATQSDFNADYADLFADDGDDTLLDDLFS